MEKSRIRIQMRSLTSLRLRRPSSKMDGGHCGSRANFSSCVIICQALVNACILVPHPKLSRILDVVLATKICRWDRCTLLLTHQKFTTLHYYTWTCCNASPTTVVRKSNTWYLYLELGGGVRVTGVAQIGAANVKSHALVPRQQSAAVQAAGYRMSVSYLFQRTGWT